MARARMWQLYSRLMAVMFVFVVTPVLGEEMRREFVVPRVVIQAGEMITARVVEKKALSVIPGVSYAVFEVPDRLIGRVARRTLRPGRAIPLDAVREASIISQGALLRVIYEFDGLSITGYATALQGGGQGDAISLRNSETGVVIKGAIQWDGTIRLLN